MFTSSMYASLRRIFKYTGHNDDHCHTWLVLASLRKWTFPHSSAWRGWAFIKPTGFIFLWSLESQGAILSLITYCIGRHPFTKHMTYSVTNCEQAFQLEPGSSPTKHHWMFTRCSMLLWEFHSKAYKYKQCNCALDNLEILNQQLLNKHLTLSEILL